VFVGNSSAGLIEAAALRVPTVNVGARQAGRERPANVVDAERESAEVVAAAVGRALEIDRAGLRHPYGEGRAGAKIAALLAGIDPHATGLVRKRCAY
ncbi:MAG TPA: UDP-N-acetylglucosamine 2-epimerase, partial [Phycisphaerales bacterium]|nr:UDP-N-acetylglucosamine 2-epimerase [Phycisphaerales bacterium]